MHDVNFKVRITFYSQYTMPEVRAAREKQGKSEAKRRCEKLNLQKCRKNLKNMLTGGEVFARIIFAVDGQASLRKLEDLKETARGEVSKRS